MQIILKGKLQSQEKWKKFAEKLKQHLTEKNLGQEWRNWLLEIYYFEPKLYLTDFLTKWDESRVLRVWYGSDRLDEDIKAPIDFPEWRKKPLKEKIDCLMVKLLHVLKGKNKAAGSAFQL